ncbi:Mov34/MPN/PAD-1 family protein [Novosphingobium sp.]|uniref:Mov34/MPN/PAD-1 family protein n=1 Tax=Novosphingobium sp. TaxID=1874826 RepID=UPI0031D62823
MTCVLLPHKLVERIRAHVRTTSSVNEQGGLLLGYRKPGAIELSDVTFPNRWDHGSATRFHRSQRGHRMKALREWLKSGRTAGWIGEWHTHPGGRAIPSSVDLQSWREVTRHQGQPMVFMIFSDRETYVGLHDGKQIRLLSAVERDKDGTLFV